MSEAKNAEAELAKVIDAIASRYNFVMSGNAIVHLAQHLISAGYAKRSETLEEAAKVAEAVQFPEASKSLPTPRRGFELAQMKIVIAICALKGHP